MQHRQTVMQQAQKQAQEQTAQEQTAMMMQTQQASKINYLKKVK